MLFFYQLNQSARSRFVRSLTKMAEAEGSFEERFSETDGATVPCYL